MHYKLRCAVEASLRILYRVEEAVAKAENRVAADEAMEKRSLQNRCQALITRGKCSEFIVNLKRYSV